MDPPSVAQSTVEHIPSDHQVLYTAAERAVIHPFRTAYLNTTTPEQRKRIATREILPALFTYWESIDPNDPRIKNMEQSSAVSGFLAVTLCKVDAGNRIYWVLYAIIGGSVIPRQTPN